jgi:hypothetical protein
MRESRRGTPSHHGTRRGQQAPRSGWQGAWPEDVTRVHAECPGDPGVVARELAEREARA